MRKQGTSSPFIKINSRIIDPHVKCKIIKLVGKIIRENVHRLGFVDEFLDTIPKMLSVKKILI